MTQEEETKLIYETLASPLIERTLSAARELGAASPLHVGKWKRAKGNRLDADQNVVQSYYNLGLPITFDLTKMPDGSLVKTRERATFLWEEGFEPFETWLPTAEWLDGIMFRTTLPQDFTVALAHARTLYDGGIRREQSTFHFQPVSWRRRGRYDPSYDDLLDINHTFANVGCTIHAFEIETNYWAFERDSVESLKNMFIEMGFQYDALWMRPPGERHRRVAIALAG